VLPASNRLPHTSAGSSRGPWGLDACTSWCPCRLSGEWCVPGTANGARCSEPHGRRTHERAGSDEWTCVPTLIDHQTLDGSFWWWDAIVPGNGQLARFLAGVALSTWACMASSSKALGCSSVGVVRRVKVRAHPRRSAARCGRAFRGLRARPGGRGRPARRRCGRCRLSRLPAVGAWRGRHGSAAEIGVSSTNTFRPREARNKRGIHFTSILPAISPEAPRRSKPEAASASCGSIGAPT
jgi:hypothetical protein